ncbi:MAG: hypothetical protein HQ582_02285 [Planctomycetes bacterium]|nr:hypothetical protein [Planctomycetota bacterium]
MDHAITDLRALQRAEVANTDPVLEWLRLQEEASRLVGFQGIASLCRDLEDCLTEARDDEPSRLAAEAATLSAVCRTIQLHADMVGKSLSRSDGDDAARRTTATDTAHSMPPAPMLARSAKQKGGDCGQSPTG